MTKLLVALLFLFACTQIGLAKDTDDFPLKVHITAVEMQQANTGVTGTGSTDSNGNYHSSVSGGGTYYWHLFTAKIDGNSVTYKLSTRARKGFMKRAAILHIGDYAGRWNKKGTLEIQYTNSKGKPDHETFNIQSEFKDESTQAKSPE
jgi:hypothetical protein